MHFQFLLSDPHGDIELSPEGLEQPFLTGPEEQHPFLTLGDYFRALQEFLTLAEGKHLRTAIKQQGLPPAINLSDIAKIIIRSEKHGAFYHIASITLVGPGENLTFAVTTAVSEQARSFLAQEVLILQQLADLSPDFLPRLYSSGSVCRQTESGPPVEFLMLLGEWLDNFHEWHVSDDPQAEKQKIKLWDYGKGFRFLSDAESHDLLRRAACILTYYYDQAAFRQIYPWHHGAGDFVVRCDSGKIAVKLITARQYEPLVHFDQAEEADQLVAAIHFLLNLGLRIRLDRCDGVGEPAWLGAYAVHAAVEGFFAGLAATESEGRLLLGPVAEFLGIMRSFDAQEILEMHAPLLAIYADEDQDDLQLIREELPEHAEQLHKALQKFTLA